MARDWHSTFAGWSKPPSDTEEAKAERAATMIREAIRASDVLRDKQIDVYASGSYRNNTNVQTDSDIDVAVVCRKSIWSDKPPGITDAMLGLSPSTYSLDDVRRDVGSALSAKFGAGVSAGDKAFDVRETSTRLDADVAVFLEYRRYSGGRNAAGGWDYLTGVETRPRSAPSTRIINWHQQHYDRGVERNLATRRRFKRVVRILKRLRGAMLEEGTSTQRASAESAASYLIESLVFNAPDGAFNRSEHTYVDDVREVVRSLWHLLDNEARANALVEVNRIKPLFDPSQRWTRIGAKEFLGHAWTFAGFT